MSLRIDTSEWISGALVIGETGLGVRGDAVPSTGTHGAGILYNDITLPGEAADEFRALLLSVPAGGTFFMWEDSSFTATGYPDGTYNGTYEGFKNGVSYGTATYSFTIGAAGATIVAAGIASAEAFGAPEVAASLVLAGIASAEAIGTPGIGAGVAGAGITSEEAFGPPVVGASIVGQGISSAEALGEPTVGPAVLGAGLASEEAFGQPAIAASVDAAGIASGETFGEPTVFVSGEILAAGIPSEEAFGQPTVFDPSANPDTTPPAGGNLERGRVSLAPTRPLPHRLTLRGIPSAEGFGAPGIVAQIGVLGFEVGFKVGQPRIKRLPTPQQLADEAAWMLPPVTPTGAMRGG